MREYRCEVCGIVDTRPIHWFVIQCGDSQLSVHRWSSEAAEAGGARHFCGEAHAEVYISRWFDSVCSPPKPDFNLPSTARWNGDCRGAREPYRLRPSSLLPIGFLGTNSVQLSERNGGLLTP